VGPGRRGASTLRAWRSPVGGASRFTGGESSRFTGGESSRFTGRGREGRRERGGRGRGRGRAPCARAPSRPRRPARGAARHTARPPRGSGTQPLYYCVVPQTRPASGRQARLGTAGPPRGRALVELLISRRSASSSSTWIRPWAGRAVRARAHGHAQRSRTKKHNAEAGRTLRESAHGHAQPPQKHQAERAHAPSLTNPNNNNDNNDNISPQKQHRTVPAEAVHLSCARGGAGRPWSRPTRGSTPCGPS